MSKPQVNLDYDNMVGTVTFLQKIDGPFGLVEKWIDEDFQITDELVLQSHEFMVQHAIELAREAPKESEAA